MCDWSRPILIVNGTIQRAGSPGRRLGEQENLGVQAPSMRNSHIVVAILQGHHAKSFCLQCELSAREIRGHQQHTGTAEASSFQTWPACCQWGIHQLLG